jgi:methionyl aminopeptidase
LHLAERHGRPRESPGPYTLKDGDVLSVDVGVTLDGFVGDSAYTFPVGEVDEDARGSSTPARRRSTRRSSRRSPGNHLSDIGHAVRP